MTKPRVLALIPARGGSKSVPRKNVLPVGGKPLIAYSIGHALECSRVERTIVSTDDDEIRDVALRYGAEVPFRRPDAYATDTATDLDVFRHALTWLAQHEGYVPELLVHLRPTGPMRDVALIEEAIARMLDCPAADALRSVSLAEQTPYKMWRVQGGYLEPVLRLPGFPEAHSMPRQALPPVYWQNGYVDVVRPRAVLEQGSMCGKVVLPFVISGRVHELDYPDQIAALEAAVTGRERVRVQSPEEPCQRHPA